jgi:outer membrane protein TolC
MKILFFFSLLLLSPVTWAQQNLTISNAIDTALRYNFDIQIAKNYIEISKINNSYGVAGGAPSININATNNNSSYDLNQKLSTGIEINKNNVTSHSVNAGITAGMILFNGFKVLATRERLSILESQSELELNLQIQNTIAAVMVTYYNIIRQQSYRDIIQSTLDVSLKKTEIVTERYNVGMANKGDLLQAQMDLNLAEQTLVSQKLVIGQEKVNLQRLMGVKQFFSYSIVDTIIVDTTIQRDAIINYLENNPQYLSAEQQVKINEQVVKELRAQRIPSVRINAGYNYIYNSSSGGFNLFNQNYGPLFGASMQIPIFNGTIYKSQQDVASINVINAELQKEDLLLALKADALNTFHAYESTLLQISSQQKIYKNATELVSIVIQRFQSNQATILDVKAAQTSMENAGYILVNLQFDAKTAEIELKRLIYHLSY